MKPENVALLERALDDAMYYLHRIQGAVWWRDGETLVTAEDLCTKIKLALATAKANEAGISL